MEDDSPSNQAKIGQLVRRKEGFGLDLGDTNLLVLSPPHVLNYVIGMSWASAVHQKERVQDQDQDQDQDDEQEHVRSPKPVNSSNWTLGNFPKPREKNKDRCSPTLADIMQNAAEENDAKVTLAWIVYYFVCVLCQ